MPFWRIFSRTSRRKSWKTARHVGQSGAEQQICEYGSSTAQQSALARTALDAATAGDKRVPKTQS